jgi:protoporphyrinogen/coproporphyrinogen III oxidase
MSAAATYPPLLTAAEKRGSLMRALRAEIPAPSENPPPAFWAIEGGMTALIERLRTTLTARGVEFRYNAPVDRLERLEPIAGAAARWNVMTRGPEAGNDLSRQSNEVDAVVLAVPAPVAAQLLRPHDDESAGLLSNIAYATVNLVTFRIPAAGLPTSLTGTGFLVPRRSPAAPGQESWAVTACTYLSQKWPHVAAEGDVLLRVSVGRFGDVRADSWSDEELTDRAWAELGLLVGPLGDPLESMVARWPGAFPQYRVHHLMRTAGIEAAVARLGGIAVAGAAYRGVGIPACIASGRTAARAVS